MKKGDKVVCKKSLLLGDSRLCVKDKIYEISLILKDEEKIIYKIKNIFFTEVEDSINEYFYNYFIPLSKWREQQINSILE